MKLIVTKDIHVAGIRQLAAFGENHEKAKTLLASHLEYLCDEDIAKEMWASLANAFTNKCFTMQTYFRRSLRTSLMNRRFDELMRQ